MKRMSMCRTPAAVIVAGLLAVAGANCSKASTSAAETQPGGAADLNKPPQAGGARANCSDLPSADDLKKWLRAAPGVDGEAGGLFSGKMEWASIVSRNG